MPSPTFDQQSHSIRSDGELPPAEVVRNAAAAGVELLALSDHDSANGVEEAITTLMTGSADYHGPGHGCSRASAPSSSTGSSRRSARSPAEVAAPLLPERRAGQPPVVVPG